MRFATTYFALFLLLLGNNTILAQYFERLSPYPSADQSQNIHIYNSNLLFTSGANGSFLKSTNSGVDWTFNRINLNGDIIHGLWFTSELIGYAAGYHYSIHKTTDGGSSWTQIEREPATGNGYWGLVFTDANTGYAVGDNGVIKKTTNAGATWFSLTSGVSTNLYDIIHLGGNTLLVCGDGQIMLRSTNGGSTWSQINSQTTYTKNLFATFDKNTIYAATAWGTITKSTDAGLTWNYISAVRPTERSIYGIYFTSNQIGYIADQYAGIFKTTDGGNSWSAASTGIEAGEYFYSIAFINTTTGFVTGAGGALYKTTNAGASWSKLNRGISGNAYIFAAAFTSESIGYAADAFSPSFHKTTDAGVNWTQSNTGSAGGITDFKFRGVSNCYAVTDAPSFLYSSNAGNNWNEVSLSGLVGYPMSINFPTDQIGYIAETGKKLIKTTNGGANWNLIKDFGLKTIQFSCFLSESVGFVCGDGGFISKTTDGGVSWTDQTSNTTKPLYSIYFLDSNNGVATGEEVVLITTNGGTTWSVSLTQPSKIFYKAKFINASNILVCGLGGSIFYSGSSGSTWNNYSTGLNSDELYTIEVVEDAVFVFGGSGLILKNLVPLPVELTLFSAKVRGQNVELTWQTATEAKNYGFEVEKRLKTEGTQTWAKIGFVPGSGNSNSPKSYSFTDKIVSTETFLYRLKQIDTDGTTEYSSVIEVNVAAPNEFTLLQNYPNPFNPTTVIAFDLPEKSDVNLTVFSSLGEEITTLLQGTVDAGRHTVSFNAEGLPSGIYFYRITAGSFTSVRKLMLVR